MAGLEGSESARTSRKYAVVEIPATLFPRMIFLPTEKWHPFVLIEDLIASFASELFPGFEIAEKGVMRLTRGAELTFDEEKDEDFMRVMTEALRDRREGDIVRLEVSADGPWVAVPEEEAGDRRRRRGRQPILDRLEDHFPAGLSARL